MGIKESDNEVEKNEERSQRRFFWPFVKQLFNIKHLFILTTAIVLSGCATPGFDERHDVSQEMRTRLMQESSDLLSGKSGTLSLQDTLRIGRERSLKLTSARLEAELASIRRDASFAVFLPRVTGTYGIGNFDAHASGLGYSYDNSTLDGDITGIRLVQPVFTPAAWLMYVEAGYGKRISEIRLARTTELLDLRIAQLYHQLVIASRLEDLHRTRLEADSSMADRLEKMLAEGYALQSDVLRIRARVSSDEIALRDSRNKVILTRGKLNETLHLWQLAEYGVVGESLAVAAGAPWEWTDDEGNTVMKADAEMRRLPLEDFIWQGLIGRKELYASDQAVAARKTEVMKAMAGFLPNIAADVGWTSLSLEHLTARYWNAALVGSWSIFSGFSTVNEYRAAKARQSSEFLIREDRMMVVVTSVVEAWQNWKIAAGRAESAELAREAARHDYDETEKRLADGQETASRLLDKLAALEAAEIAAETARYSEALAGLVLREAVGNDIFKEEEK